MEVDDREYSEAAGAGVMVSNLPLLFSKGSPSSLHYMTLSELEVFVPFMVRCSVGEERPMAWAQLPRPIWWPKKLPFRMPTCSNSHTTRLALVSLVEKCYGFHGCEYLLQFCGSLVAQMPSSGYRFNDNRDGTTSMYHGSTGKLLVTFRNENREYDKFSHDRRGRDATRKLLLSPSHSSHNHHHHLLHPGGERRSSSNGAANPMCQPPPTDIYLCDKCESEFYSLREVQNHERHCCGDAPPSPTVPSPEPEPVEEDPQPDEQIPFLAYFKLRPAEHTGLEPYTSPRKRTPSSPPRRLLPGPLYPRYESVPLTSPLGRFLISNSKFRNKYQVTQHSVMRYERHMPATPNTDTINFKESRYTNRWLVVWRGRKDQPPWVHIYCFNRAQRRERSITINTGLDLHSRRLLRVCKPVKVKLKRLQKRLVNRLLRLGGPSAPCIDLTEESHLDPSLALSPNSANTYIPNWPSNVMQWVAGLPQGMTGLPEGMTSGLPQGSSGAYLPGVSGFMTPAALNNSLASVKFKLPDTTSCTQTVVTGAWQDSSSITHSIIHSSVPHKASMAQLPTSHHLNQALSMSMDGNKLLAKAGTSLSADISLIPLHTINNSMSYQVNSDVMKPLSRKRFAMRDPLALDPGVSHPRDAVTISATGTTSHNSVHGESSMLHFLPTQNDTKASIGNSLVLSDHNLAQTNSSIEIIDLSSDEDELGRGRGRNEADNAPQQLDGLACYPHSGAKVPDSSQYSSSKNGNSHWSSKYKSRCGTGRGGDLATNGRSPYVPPSMQNSPVPNCSLFLPTTAIPPPPTQGPKTKGNSRKRKRETRSSSPHRGKTIILDISSMGVQVSEGQVSLVSSHLIRNPPEEVLPAIPEDISNMHSNINLDSSQLRASEQIGAFENSKKSYESSNLFIVDEDISFKSPIHRTEDISLQIKSTPIRVHNYKEVESRKSAQKGMTSGNTSGSGFITNIVNTMSKGVSFFKSLVGVSSDEQYTSVDALNLKEYNGSSRQEHEGLSSEARRMSSSLFDAKKNCKEVKDLLNDECRELRLNGLSELQHPDLENVKVTRRSVERLMPGKSSPRHLGHPRQSSKGRGRPKKYNTDDVPSNNNLKVKIPNVSDRSTDNLVTTQNVSNSGADRIEGLLDAESGVLHKGSYSGGIDENGNSASYMELPPDRQTAEKCLRKSGAGVLSECNRAPSDTGDSVTGSGSLSFEKSDNVRKVMVSSDMPVKSTVFSDISRGNEIYDRYSSNSDSNNATTNGKIQTNSLVNEKCVCSVTKDLWDKSLLKDRFPSKSLGVKIGQMQEQPDITPCYYDITSCFCGKSMDSSKRDSQIVHHSPRMFYSPGKTELTGETAEECGAWQAQFPLPQHSSTLTCLPTSPKNNKPLLLHSMKKSSISLKLTSPPIVKSMKKPRGKSSLHELRRLVSDEWKELKGSGFHPSDLVETEGLNYYMASSDEDDDSTGSNSPASINSVGNSLDYSCKSPSRPLLLHSMKKNSPLSLTLISEPPQHPKSVKKSKHKRLLRELSNLATDEWKELRGSGFHPSDLVGTEEVDFSNASSDEEERLSHSLSKTPTPEPKVKKNDKSSDTCIGKSDRKLSKKLSRELAMLLVDECKELKRRRGKVPKPRSEWREVKSNRKPSQINGTSKQTFIVNNVRNNHMRNNSNIPRGCRVGKPKKRRILGNLWPLMRSTRSQASAAIILDTPTPRTSHREILQAETAMCVLNYKLPNII